MNRTQTLTISMRAGAVAYAPRRQSRLWRFALAIVLLPAVSACVIVTDPSYPKKWDALEKSETSTLVGACAAIGGVYNYFGESTGKPHYARYNSLGFLGLGAPLTKPSADAKSELRVQIEQLPDALNISLTDGTLIYNHVSILRSDKDGFSCNADGVTIKKALPNVGGGQFAKEYESYTLLKSIGGSLVEHHRSSSVGFGPLPVPTVGSIAEWLRFDAFDENNASYHKVIAREIFGVNP